jgi:hypothetical protein
VFTANIIMFLPTPYKRMRRLGIVPRQFYAPAVKSPGGKFPVTITRRMREQKAWYGDFEKQTNFGLRHSEKSPQLDHLPVAWAL